MIYTSCYVKLWEIRDAVPDAVFISISGYPAPWFKEFSQLEYKKLAPKKVWWQEWHDRFERDLESKESREWVNKLCEELKLENHHGIDNYYDMWAIGLPFGDMKDDETKKDFVKRIGKSLKPAFGDVKVEALVDGGRDD